jgi:hypothetical protein
VLHHVNKRDTSDPLERVSGTTAITGSADAILVLDHPRGQGHAVLWVSGRDVEEQAFPLTFKDGLWTLEGDPQETLSPVRVKLLDVLRQADRPLSPKEVAEILGMGDEKGRSSVRQTLTRMARDGQVTPLGSGVYILPAVTPVTVSQLEVSPPLVTDTLPEVSQGGVLGNEGEFDRSPPSVTPVTANVGDVPLTS